MKNSLIKLKAHACGLLIMGLFGCVALPKDTRSFSHDQHMAPLGLVTQHNGGAVLGCRDCHTSNKAIDYAVLRPGTQDHAPCDAEGCHADAFYQLPGPLCSVCHTSVNPRQQDASPLKPYQQHTKPATTRHVSTFDHRAHLERATTDGVKLRCASCHATGGKEDAYVGFPTHDNCAPCHANQAKPAMEQCVGCHADAPTQLRQFAKNDVRFNHGKHAKDNAGADVACQQCHYAVAQSSHLDQPALPLMVDCATCHENAAKTPDRVQMSDCGVCHTDSIDSKPLVGEQTAARVPQGPFLTLDEFVGADAVAVVADNSAFIPDLSDVVDPQHPDNHTLLFRTRHGEAASSRNAKCQHCHTGLPATPRDSCNACHSVMRPRDHTLRWRSVLHGREASKHPKRCSTCHEVDFCSECHSIPPPSHSPLVAFRYRHDRLARFNPRSCMTCHTFESSCVECHQTSIAPDILRQGLRQGGLW